MSGKRCALLTRIGSWGISSSAVCFDWIVEPSGSLTSNPEVIFRFSIQSLWICKKCPVVPESAIAMFCLSTAAAYEYGFVVSIAHTIFFSSFVRNLGFSMLFRHKLMLSVIGIFNTLLLSTLICGPCHRTRLRFFCEPPLLFAIVASCLCPTAGVLHVSDVWSSWMLKPCEWQ